MTTTMTDPDPTTRAVGHIARALWAQAQARRAVEALDGAGVPALLLKGPDLQVRLYGSPAAYASGDIDLLVPRERASEARRALERAGWGFDRANGILWRLSRAASFDRSGFLVDLHWGLHAAHLPAWSLRSLEDRMWAGARVGPGGMREPDAASLLVFLAVHVVGHGFERPEWAENVHRAAALVEDWDEVWRIARETRVERAVRAALEGRTTGTRLRVLDGVRGRLVWSATWVARGHFLPRRWRDRVREVERRAASPTRGP